VSDKVSGFPYLMFFFWLAASSTKKKKKKTRAKDVKGNLEILIVLNSLYLNVREINAAPAEPGSPTSPNPPQDLCPKNSLRHRSAPGTLK
jgi:hypothetical protein